MTASLPRYTLPYREETVVDIVSFFITSIHPPIQGGNAYHYAIGSSSCDTPSHTGRKLSILVQCDGQNQYTLPYREETMMIAKVEWPMAIHPPIQGGNVSSLKIWKFWYDTPSHTGRKHSVFMRVRGSLNTALCILHNNCIIRYFAGNLSYLICHFFEHRQKNLEIFEEK